MRLFARDDVENEDECRAAFCMDVWYNPTEHVDLCREILRPCMDDERLETLQMLSLSGDAYAEACRIRHSIKSTMWVERLPYPYREFGGMGLKSTGKQWNWLYEYVLRCNRGQQQRITREHEHWRAIVRLALRKLSICAVEDVIMERLHVDLDIGLYNESHPLPWCGCEQCRVEV